MKIPTRPMAKQDETKSTEPAGSKDKEGDEQPSKDATNDGKPTNPTPTPNSSTKQEDHQHQPVDNTAPLNTKQEDHQHQHQTEDNTALPPKSPKGISASASISFDQHDNYYKIMGVSEFASHAEVKRAYRERSLVYHPDKNQGSEESTKKFQLIQQAYDTLADPSKRFKYNEQNKLALNQPSEVLPSAAAPGLNSTKLQAEEAARNAAKELQKMRTKEKRETAARARAQAKAAAASPKAKANAKAKGKAATKPKPSPKKTTTRKKRKHPDDADQDQDEEVAPEKDNNKTKKKKEDPPVASLPTAYSVDS